ncbi:MAG: universal stress protein [Desulfocapsaceae bacterium]|nr:universal stress protein [Desulfocapsaceae bacterium]
MFKHLLVPLDGSKMAEAALPAAVYLAGGQGARLTLLHVIERGAPREVHGQRHLTSPDEAQGYLDEVAARFISSGVLIDLHVHANEVRDVALSIAGHVQEFGPDLISMCTHGSGGLRGFLFGRIAQQVMSLVSTPLFLVPPASEGFTCRKIVVPLDGNPDHEEGLRFGKRLAEIYRAELHLIMVVHTSSTLSGEKAVTAKMLPRVTRALLDLAEEDARQYLQRHLTDLQASGFTATAAVRRGNPAKIIGSTADRTGADLVVLATHGKTGLDAFWSGSATPDVASRSPVPLLLVPATPEISEPQDRVS